MFRSLFVTLALLPTMAVAADTYTFDGEVVVSDRYQIITAKNPAYRGLNTFLVSCDKDGECAMGEDDVEIDWRKLVGHVIVLDPATLGSNISCDKYLCKMQKSVIGLNPSTYAAFLKPR